MERWATMTITATLAVGLGAAVALPASASPVPVGERCDAVSYAWSGEVTVGAGASTVAIGLEVPSAVPGETVRVESVHLDAGAQVSVGGVVVDGGGDEIAGGGVALHHDGDPMEVTAVTLDVARCALVAQATTRPTTTRSAGAPSAVPIVIVSSPRAELPSTGAPTLGLALAALGCLLAGSALVAGSRRFA